MNERFIELYKQAEKSVAFLSNSKQSKEKIVQQKFAELIIKDVLNLFGDELISLHHLEQPCCEDAVYLLKSKVMDRFGVKYPHG